MEREDWQAQRGRTAISLADAYYQMCRFVYDMTKETAPLWLFYGGYSNSAASANGVIVAVTNGCNGNDSITCCTSAGESA
jgi:hypothetical protein